MSLLLYRYPVFETQNPGPDNTSFGQDPANEQTTHGDTTPLRDSSMQPKLPAKLSILTALVLFACMAFPPFATSQAAPFIALPVMVCAGVFLCIRSRAVSSILLIMLPAGLLSVFTMSFIIPAIYLSVVCGTVCNRPQRECGQQYPHFKRRLTSCGRRRTTDRAVQCSERGKHGSVQRGLSGFPNCGHVSGGHGQIQRHNENFEEQQRRGHVHPDHVGRPAVRGVCHWRQLLLMEYRVASADGRRNEPRNARIERITHGLWHGVLFVDHRQ